MDGLGFSWKNLRQQNIKPVKLNTIPSAVSVRVEQETDAVFTQEDLELQWLSMCNRIPQQYSGIATRMKNMNPVIKLFPAIEVFVDNALVKQEMEDFKGRILKTLQTSLHNDGITLEITIVEHEGPIKILTRREQFEIMSNENPAVEKLRQAFDLELA